MALGARVMDEVDGAIFYLTNLEKVMTLNIILVRHTLLVWLVSQERSGGTDGSSTLD